jgi:TonB family protein
MGVISLDKMEIVGNDYIAYVTIDEEQLDFYEYVINMQSNKSTIASLILGYNNQFAEIFKASELNLIYVVRGSVSKKEAKIVYSAYELNNAPDKETGFSDFINETIAQTKRQLPLDWGDGLTLTDVYLEDNNFCYKVLTDESVMTMEMLQSLKAEGTMMEDNMLAVLADAEDPVTGLFVKHLTDADMGMKYVFWAEGSYKSVTFTLTPEKLRSAVNGGRYEIGAYDDFDIEFPDEVEEVEEEVEEEAIPFQLVEEKPSFQGGDSNQFSKWVNANLVYPEIARKNAVQGRVTVQFKVEKDGSVTNVKVLRGVDPALDAEAVRVVSASPKWKPGKQRGRAVAVIYTFPVIFQLR